MSRIITPGAPHLWVPKHAYIDAQDALRPPNLICEGIIGLKAIDRRGRVTREREFHNMLMDTGLQRIMRADSHNGIGAMSWAVGTGTTAPTFTDAGIQSQVGGWVTITVPQMATLVNSGGATAYASGATASTSAIGAFGTTTLTEVGLRTTDATTLFFARELIRDSGGSPVGFPITSDEQLRLTYGFRIYPDPALWAGHSYVANIAGVDRDCVTRWSFISVSGANAQLAASINTQTAHSTGMPSGWDSGTGGAISGNGNVTRSNPSAYVQNATHAYGTGDANGTIARFRSTIGCSNGGFYIAHQTTVSPPVVKTSAQTMQIHSTLGIARKEY